MIVATRPDPTVRPPSRYFNPVLPHIFYGFLSKIQWKTAELHHLFWFAWFLGTVLAPENTQTDFLCLLYTSDAADEEDSVDLGGRRINKKKKK